VYPKLRGEEQLKRREWELRCPYCGEFVKPIPTCEEKSLHNDNINKASRRAEKRGISRRYV